MRLTQTNQDVRSHKLQLGPTFDNRKPPPSAIRTIAEIATALGLTPGQLSGALSTACKKKIADQPPLPWARYKAGTYYVERALLAWYRRTHS
jgi:hypothetical protein